MWRDLVKQQYRRAEAYTLWGESFKAFASGAMSPQEFESNVTLNVVPVLQEVGAAIRSLAALEPDASVQRWVEAVQVQEKVRYEATVLAMYTTIRHMGDVSMHSNECPSFSERSFGCFTLQRPIGNRSPGPDNWAEDLDGDMGEAAVGCNDLREDAERWRHLIRNATASISDLLAEAQEAISDGA